MNLPNSNLPIALFQQPVFPSIKKRSVNDIMNNVPFFSKPGQVYDEYQLHKPKSRKGYAYQALRGVQQVSPFAELFFSKENVDELQRQIRYQVYLQSGKRIPFQNEDDVVVAMRGIYIQYSTNPTNPSDYPKAIMDLNKQVIDTVLPGMVTTINQYVTYLSDAFQPRQIIDNPVNTSTKGTIIARDGMDVLLGSDYSY